MTADEILTDVARVYLNDVVQPTLWSDDFLLAALNRAEQEAATRTLCLYDDATADVCQITLATGTTRYALDPLILRVDSVYHAGALLEQVDPVDMDRLYGPGWRPAAGAPQSWFAKDTRHLQLTAAPTVAVNGTKLNLGVYRLPLADMADPTDEPEVPAWMHRALAHWVCAEAYLVVDADSARPDLVAEHMTLFDNYFGPPVGAQVNLSQRRTPRPVKTTTAPYSSMLADVQQADWNGRAQPPAKAKRAKP